MNIGNKIKKLRYDHQMTQEQLAEKLHVTRNAISKWETDKGFPNIDSLIQLCQLFNISIDSLFSNEEIVKISLENKEYMEYNKNLIYSIIIFFVFTSLGILIPHFCFRYDPTSGMVVFLIILPLSYILLGIISVLIKLRWPFVIISSALALTPIYLYFDSLSSVILGFWGIIYFILYNASFLVLSRMVEISLKKNNPSRVKKLFFILSVIISCSYLIHTVIKVISLYNCVGCSAPWYTAIVINTLFYSVPLIISYTLFIYYRFQINKDKSNKDSLNLLN